MENQQIYKLPIFDTLRTAWHKMSGAKRTLWTALAIVIFSQILFSIIDTGLKHHSFLLGQVVSLFTIVISYLLQMGVIYIVIIRAMELPISYRLITRAFDGRVAFKLIGCYLLEVCIFLPFILLSLSGPIFIYLKNPTLYNQVSDPIRIGLILFIMSPWWLLALSCMCFLILLYLAIRLYVAMGLILDKAVGPFQAIKLSFHATRGNMWRLLILAVLKIIILAITVIPLVLGVISPCPSGMFCFDVKYLPLGIGLLWSLPFIFVCYGVIYKRLLANVK